MFQRLFPFFEVTSSEQNSTAIPTTICSFHLVASGEDTTQHYCQTLVKDFAGTCK